VQRQCASVVTERSQDAWGGSSLEKGTTVLPFERRRHHVPQELGTPATLGWRQASSHGDGHARSTLPHPLLSR
jgi:hypothetical protein